MASCLIRSRSNLFNFSFGINILETNYKTFTFCWNADCLIPLSANNFDISRDSNSSFPLLLARFCPSKSWLSFYLWMTVRYHFIRFSSFRRNRHSLITVKKAEIIDIPRFSIIFLQLHLFLCLNQRNFTWRWRDYSTEVWRSSFFLCHGPVLSKLLT